MKSTPKAATKKTAPKKKANEHAKVNGVLTNEEIDANIAKEFATLPRMPTEIPEPTAGDKRRASRDAYCSARAVIADLKEWFVMHAWEVDEGGKSDQQDVVRGIALLRALQGHVEDIAPEVTKEMKS